MRVALALVPAAALACAPAGPEGASPEAATPSTSEHAIINGEACTEAIMPTAMAIMVDADVDFGQGEPFNITTIMCTGTLIAPDVVLTAAHCVDPTGLTFGFGTVTRADFYVSFQADLTALAAQDQQTPAEIPESAIPVREALGHPEFDISTMTAETVNGPGDFKDVGLLFLDVAIEDVAPELVMTREQGSALKVGAAVEIAGWGQQTVTSNPFEPPPAGTVGKKICGASTINEVGEFEMQIGGDASTTRKCHGDSGGPTYLVIDGTKRVVGITSHAYDAEDCNKGGVDTRVDVWLDWIEGEMLARCEAGTRAFCDDPGLDPGPGPGPIGEGEGEGEGEGDGDDDDDGDDDGPGGCASVPTAPFALALATLALRRRRR